MTEQEKTRLRRLLEGFFSSRGLMKHLTSDALVIWLDALSDLSIDEIQEGIRGYSRNSNEFPTPAAIRKYAGVQAMNNTDRALAAWDVAMKAMRRYGHYHTVDFDDHLVNAAIRQMGGWEDFGAWQSEKTEWKKKEFLQLYESISRTGRGNGSPLIGYHDRVNSSHGHPGKEQVKRIPCGMPEHPKARLLSRRDLKRIESRPYRKSGTGHIEHFAESMEVS